MSSQPHRDALGLSEEDAARLGEDGAVRVRTFRLIVLVAQELRTLMDQLLRADGLTTQQAAMITVVDLLGTPSLSQAATALEPRTKMPGSWRTPWSGRDSYRSAPTTPTRGCDG